MYLNAHSIPDGFFNVYHPLQFATDKNETFAVFLLKGLGWGVKMVIFTEEGGFVPVYDTEQADKEPENVFNWCLCSQPVKQLFVNQWLMLNSLYHS